VRLRILQSFPHKIGAARICSTAWHQASGVAAAGGDLSVYAGVVHRTLPPIVDVHTTLSRGRVRIPYSVLGTSRALMLHDRVVARALPQLAGRIDIVHAWPLAALETLRAARRLGMPAVLERPNAHTRFAYEVVRVESERLGIQLPRDHEHAFNAARLAREEAEYAIADRLLCPSDFVLQSFIDRGFPEQRLIRHGYGYDERRFRPGEGERNGRQGLTVLFAGVCAVRKGLHFALDAWVRSSASIDGTLLIAGEFLPEYRDKLAGKLAHPSVRVLGHTNSVPELMREADLLLLPSIEEGSPLVAMEAIGSGCVPLVSEVCRGACRHGANALVHPTGDVGALRGHLDAVDADRSLLSALREGCLASAPELTWQAAGRRLLDVYGQVVHDCEAGPAVVPEARPRVVSHG
jgi:glycosyltransferase involved in cell wall biosynthesis